MIVFPPDKLHLIKATEEPKPDTVSWLKDMISQKRWDEVPPIWLEERFFAILGNYLAEEDIFQPYVIYNGNSRLSIARENKLPLRAHFYRGHLSYLSPSIPNDEWHRPACVL